MRVATLGTYMRIGPSDRYTTSKSAFSTTLITFFMNICIDTLKFGPSLATIADRRIAGW
jgi:hypothetical protein